MRKYHVYGIGNALVDMEYEVDVGDLDKLRIDKGVMTLVDAAHQTEIMEHLKGHHHQKGSGGSAANSVIAVSQLGGRAFYSCKVANDRLGHFYMEDLIEGGVDTNHHTDRDHGHTGRCVVLVTPDTDRTMITHLGISGELSEKELVVEALRDSEYFYTEGYLVTSDPARMLSITAKRIAEEAGVKTAISLSDPNMVTHFKPGLMDMIGWHNSQEIGAVLSYNSSPGTRIMHGIHYLSLNSLSSPWLDAGGEPQSFWPIEKGPVRKFLGIEADFGMEITVYDPLIIYSGLAILFPGKGDPPTFFYIASRASF